MPHLHAKPVLASAAGASGAASVNAWLLHANPFIALALAVAAATLGVAAKQLRNPPQPSLRSGELIGRYFVGIAIGISVYVFLEETTTKRAYLIALTWIVAYSAESVLPKLEQAAVRLAIRIFGDDEGKKPHE